MTKLQIIGGGRMGHALVGGLIKAGWATAQELAVIEVDSTQRQHLVAAFPGVAVSDAPVGGIDSLVAVKPHLVLDVCAGLVEPRRVVSIAAGVTIAAMADVLPAGTSILRVMPNTPALVGEGAAGLAGGDNATDDDVAWATDILSAVGSVVVVAEAKLDAVTGLSGSGPAYVFLLAEALIDAGVAVGLNRSDAATLASKTIYGAGKMLVETGLEPMELRTQVTTPAGTTAAGLGRLEEHGIRAAVAAAVRAATDRSAELGQ